MRTYDEESTRTDRARVAAAPTSSMTAQRAMADDRPETLGAGDVLDLQRTAGNGTVTSMLEQEERSPVLDVVGSGGSPLDHDTRSQMEAAFGHDFGDVRVHTDQKASESAKAVQASAYTIGNDVVFQGDTYSPGSDTGMRTLAHELTHVVQQRSGPVDGTPTAGGVSVSHPSDRFERAAEETADRLVSGGRPTLDMSHSPGAGAVQRELAQHEEAVDALIAQRQEMGEEEEELPETP